MKTAFTLTLALLASSMYASTPFPENFETCADLSEIGWEAASTVPEKFSWSVAEYSAETTQFPVNIPVPDVGGQKCLKGLTGGFNVKVAPDITLVSPTFVVEPGETNLRFLYCNNMVTNGGGNVPEGDRAVFTVSVSPDGGKSEEDFTDILFEETPVNKHLWRVVNVDLSKYEGKEVSLRFRCKMANPAKPYTYNFLYIDNLELTSSPSPDLQALTLSGFVAGTDREQHPTVTFVNNGSAAEDVQLTLRAAGGETLTETYPGTIAGGETVEYSFKNPLVLPAGFDSTVEFEVSHPADPFTQNNTVSTGAKVFANAELPFELAEGTDGAYQMITTAQGTPTVPDGWQFITGSHNAWVSTYYKKEAWLYPTESYHLSGRPLKISYSGNMVGETGVFEVYLTKRADDFGEPIGTVSMTNGAVDNVIILPVAEEGDYLIAFKVCGWTALKNQFKLNTLRIEEAAGNPDLAAMSVTPSGAVVAGMSIPVTLRLSNQGAEEALNVDVAYTVGGETVTETIERVASGETIEWTFATPASFAEGEQQLTATVTHNLDLNGENNATQSGVTGYYPRQLPYRDSFEDENEVALWTIPTGSNWFVSDVYNFDGTHMLCLPGKASVNHDDWVISPAITISDGFKGRLSFYYGSGGNAGAATIEAFVTPADNPAAIAEYEPIVSRYAGNVDVDYASVMVDGLAAGTYYIAFHAKDGMQSMLLDDIRLDSSNEISIDGITLSTPLQAAYSHEPAKVTIHGRNYGMEAISNMTVAYQSSISSFGEVSLTDIVTEKYTGEIAPGEEYEFTFAAPLEFAQTGIYVISAAISADRDSDNKNNAFQVIGPEVLPTKTLPALWDNERDDYLHGYVYNEGSKWNIRALNQYAGDIALYHLESLGNPDEGDWAFLGRVYIPAGTYQASLFWSTMTGFESEPYHHSFDLTLSDAPAADASYRVILSNTSPTASDKKARKELQEFTVDADGYYYLGVHLRECGGKGSIAIDDIKIERPEAKYDLTSIGATYKSDFGEAPDEWYHYHPVKLYSQQWMPVTDPSGELHAVQAIEFTANGVTYTSSYLQAPPMLMAAGCDYRLTVQSQINAAPYDEHVDWTDLSGDEEFVIYVSDIDLPSEFKEVGRIRAGEYQKDFIVRPEETGIKYITVGTANAKCAAFTFVGLRVRNEGVAGIASPSADGDGGEGRWYTLDGVATPAPGAHGVFIHVVNGSARKVIM